MEIYFLIGGVILFWILINLIFYFYFKYTRKIFFNFIKYRKYSIVKNVETETESYQKIGAKITYRKCDIIFLEDEIFLLSFNKAIIQLSKSTDIFPGVMHKFTYYSKRKVKDRLEIANFDKSFKANLNFKNKDFDLEEYLNKSL